MAQNSLDYLKLMAGDNISVPLRCACPSRNQTRLGFKYLLSYLVAWGDTVDSIANLFGADSQSIWDANELSKDENIFPFTPILVPLKSEPVIKGFLSPPPDPSSPNVPSVTEDGKSSSRKWVFIGIGIGVAVLFLLALFGFVFCLFRRKHKPHKGPTQGEKIEGLVIPPDCNSWSVSSETVRFAIGSLTLYKFEELEKATGFFDEGNRIRGSVYRGSFQGDTAAIKIIRGDVSEEINILKQINHSNIIRLSGLCVRDGNTYLVYEYADNGSLDDWLPSDLKDASTISSSLRVLGWKQRVQIAYDVADALNYLHNYSHPPYIHKNLKSSNILLTTDLRAKVSNFGLARSFGENEDLQMTRHVVGTHGYLAPEYIENGLVTPQLDIFSFGVVLLEILSGKEAVSRRQVGGDSTEELLSVTICEVLGGGNVREKLKGFVDPCLENEYPFDLAFSSAQLAEKCVNNNLNSRPSMAEVFMTISKILSSSMDWDPSEEFDSHSRSLGHVQ